MLIEIKNELKELEQIQKDISSKYPLRSRFELKYPIFSSIGYFFKKDSKINDEYFKTLTPSQRKDFWDYVWGLMKEAWNRQLSSNNEIIKMMEALKKNHPDEKIYLEFAAFYDMLKNKPSEENKCQILREILNIPKPVIDYWMTCPRYNGLFEFYSTVIRMIDEPVDKQRRKIAPMLKELTESNKNELDKMVQEEVDTFIKKAWGVFPASPQVPNIGSQDYYRIKLFSECMQSPEKKDAIKKALQESIMMRKAIFSVIIGDQYGNVEYVKKIANGIDYDNFDQYWSLLEEKSEELVESLFSNEIRKKLEEAPGAASRKMMAQCYLECFFTPYLVLDNQ